MKGPFDTEFIETTFKIIDREATTPGPKACRRRIHSMCEHMRLAYGSLSVTVINMIHDFMLKDLEERYSHNERIYSRLKDCQIRVYRYWIRRLERWKKRVSYDIRCDAFAWLLKGEEMHGRHVVWIPEIPNVLGEGTSKEEAIEELFDSLKALVQYKGRMKDHKLDELRKEIDDIIEYHWDPFARELDTDNVIEDIIALFKKYKQV